MLPFIIGAIILVAIATTILTRKLLKDRLRDLKQRQPIPQSEKDHLETLYAQAKDDDALDLRGPGKRIEAVVKDGKVIDGYYDTVEEVDPELHDQLRGKKIKKILV